MCVFCQICVLQIFSPLLWLPFHSPNSISLFFLRFYFFIHERHREREAETQAEGEADSMQGAQCGTPSPVSRIRPWAEGAKPLSHLGCPIITNIMNYPVHISLIVSRLVCLNKDANKVYTLCSETCCHLTYAFIPYIFYKLVVRSIAARSNG